MLIAHSDVLQKIYDNAINIAFTNSAAFDYLHENVRECVDDIVSRSENNKGLVTVLTTLLTHKIVEPSQDIRYHQAGMQNGFAGRGIDQNYVTPFMKRVSFPSMAESGWLTRSLEQAHPYTLDYPGKITPKEVKEAFLKIIDKIQTYNHSPYDILLYLFVLLIRQRDSMKVELAKPHSLSIAAIVELQRSHFSAKYTCAGASRLPTLAIYAAYKCMMSQLSRYEKKILCPLENHNSSDTQSGRIGDIDVNNEDGAAYEGVEIKHEIIITRDHIEDAYEKFKVCNTSRYYLLTTANMDCADWNGLNQEIQRIARIHGCQVIVNGVYPTLMYYLRLLKDTAEFVDNYVECMKNDDTIKFQHKAMWNDLVSESWK